MRRLGLTAALLLAAAAVGVRIYNDPDVQRLVAPAPTARPARTAPTATPSPTPTASPATVQRPDGAALIAFCEQIGGCATVRVIGGPFDSTFKTLPASIWFVLMTQDSGGVVSQWGWTVYVDPTSGSYMGAE